MRRMIICASVCCVVACAVAFMLFHEHSTRPPLAPNAPGSDEATNYGVTEKTRKLAWYDENGDIDFDGIANALSQRDNYLADHQPADGFGETGTAPNLWKQLGPTNVGGRTRALVIDPARPEQMWAGAVSGGIFKTVNGGNTWTASNGNIQNYSINCLTLDPIPATNGKRILYAGTGEGFSGVGLPGIGLFKSTDSGETWKLLPETRAREWQYVNSISVTHDGATTHLLASVELPNHALAIAHSSDGGASWPTPTNGGGWASSWTAYDPNDGRNAVGDITDNDFTYDRNRAVYSTDWGASWNPVTLNGSNFVSTDSHNPMKMSWNKATQHHVYAQMATYRTLAPRR